MYSLVLHSGIVLYYASAWIGLLPLILKPSKDVLEDVRLTTMRDIGDRYLTMWNFTLQTLIFIGYLACDLLEITSIYPRLRQILEKNLDAIFYCIVVPISVFVSAAFWTLYLYDPGLVYIFPNLIGAALTPWSNHTMHTIILLTAFLKVSHRRISPIKLRKGQYYLGFLAVLYIICLYLTHYEKNVWVYPFLSYVPEPFRFFLLSLLVVALLGINFAFHRLNELYCNTTIKIKKEPVIHAEKSQ